MISKGEIKKCGFKPIEDHKAEFKSYERKIPGAVAILRHLDETEGEVAIVIVNEAGDTTQWERIVFHGKLPARYELQIILRCLGIA